MGELGERHHGEGKISVKFSKKNVENNENDESKVVFHTSKDKKEKIDETDESILRILVNNARIPSEKINSKIVIFFGIFVMLLMLLGLIYLRRKIKR